MRLRLMGNILRRPLVLIALGATAFAIAAVASPGLLGDRLREALAGVRGADARWLWVAALALVAMHACGGLAWSVALRACGSRHGHTAAVVRYGVGSGVNAVAPANLGGVVRLGLLGRIAGDHGVWRAGGAGALASTVRGALMAVLVLSAAAQGAIPLWPLLLAALAVCVAAAIAAPFRRVLTRGRGMHLVAGFRSLRHDPHSTAGVTIAMSLALVLKVAAAASVCAALGIERPIVCALLVVPAVEIACVLQLTPGNAGIGSAAVALVLHAQGVTTETAVSAGVAFGALEILAGVTAGVLAGTVLAAPVLRPRVRPLALTASAAALAIAVGLLVW